MDNQEYSKAKALIALVVTGNKSHEQRLVVQCLHVYSVCIDRCYQMSILIEMPVLLSKVRRLHQRADLECHKGTACC